MQNDGQGVTAGGTAGPPSKERTALSCVQVTRAGRWVARESRRSVARSRAHVSSAAATTTAA
ncbi:hypothetical protein [Streptomyces lavendulocolor]|uniref:hypothetical protein n=1 Tax=Streptomyces lavendulocolor TaxID=67316 RepID=UPI003C2E192A